MSTSLTTLRNSLALLVTAALGGLSALAVLGVPGDSEQQLQERRARFLALPDERQNSIRQAFGAWSAAVHPKSADAATREEAALREKTLRELHTAAASDPDLRLKLDQFNQWWTSLDASERDSVQELLLSGDAAAVSSRIFDSQQRSRRLIVDFSAGPFRFSRQFSPSRERNPDSPAFRWLSNLELTPAQYALLLDNAFPVEELSAAQQQDLNELRSDEDRLLYRTLQILKTVREGGGSNAWENIRPMIEALKTEVVNFDSAWAQEFDTRVKEANSPLSFFSRIGVMMATISVLDQAVIDFGRNLRRNFVVDNSELVNAFASSPEDVRRVLLTMPPETALERLQKIAATEHDTPDSPQRRLYRSLLSYDETLISFQRLFSWRPPGPRPGDRSVPRNGPQD